MIDNDQWQVLVDAAPTGILIVDEFQTIARANAQAERIFGYQSGTLVGVPIGTLIRDNGGNIAAIAPAWMHLTAQRADGTYLPVEITANAVETERGRFVVTAVVDDSTRRATEDKRRSQSERELVQSEERYRALAEALPQIVWTADPDGGLDYYNGRWFDFTGMSLEQTRGWGWGPVLHPDDLQHCVDVWSEAVANGTPYEIEYRFKRASDQTYRWHLGRAQPIRNVDGSIRKWFGTCTDIDDQKRALEAQQRLTEQLQFIVEATDRISVSVDQHGALQTLCDLITPRFADWVTINFIEHDGRIRNVALKHAAVDKINSVNALRGTYYLDPSIIGGVTKVFASGVPIILSRSEDSLHLDRFHSHVLPWIEDLGFGSLISVPLSVRGRVIGALTARWSQSDREYHTIDIPFFQELAKRAALAFDEAARNDRARANEELTRQLLQSSEDCIAILDLQGRLVSVNAYGRSRFTAAKCALNPGDDWLYCWHAEDQASARAALTAAASGAPGKYQARLNADEAATYWWDVALTPVYDALGKPAELLAIARDVTADKKQAAALEQSEARYRSMTNAMPQIAFTADVDGVLDFINERWIEYTGLSLEQSRQQGAAMHEEDCARTSEAWHTAITIGEDYQAECRLRRAADGAYRWHLMRAIPLRDDQGRIGRWFGTGTDIDDQKRALTEIAKARDEALDAATVKSRFLATMSHEIRTPMSGVIGMTELMLLTSLSSEQREYATIVRDSGQSLLRVINDILDFSKIEAGKLGLESVEFALRDQLASVVELLHAQFENNDISLTSAVHPSAPFAVVGDPGRLRQILMNLLGNALKFTPPGGRVHVEVTTLTVSSQHVTLRFSVTDSGIGIAEDVQSRLFQPFSQADGSTTRRFGGTGLGLSICKELVGLMGGTIGVQSTQDTGAHFWFSIPLATAADSTRRQPRVNGERRSTARSRREKILLVEDNEINTMLAVRQFAQLGFEIATVSNGCEALEATAHTDYALIFMDCHMPKMDGFEATRRIREREAGSVKYQRIIAMTADAQVEDRRACLAAGMDDYLAKPSSISNLAAMLDRWLPDSTVPSAPSAKSIETSAVEATQETIAADEKQTVQEVRFDAQK